MEQRPNHFRPEPEQAQPQQENAANDPVNSFMEEKVAAVLSRPTEAADPAFQPVSFLRGFNYLLVTYGEFHEYSVALKESIRKVTIAYEILAYSHCRDQRNRAGIEANLEADRQSFGRDQVELNDAELRVLSKISTARNIPFEPEKRNYSYGEVPISPDVDPYGRRHMTTEDIRLWLAQKPARRKK